MIRPILAVLALASMVSAATPIGVELLANGGFEDELAGSWHPNNWAKNEAVIDRVETSPHSGRYALRMSMTRILNAPVLELIAPVKLAPGDLVELRFWMRGGANIGALNFSLRPKSGPYKAFVPREFTVLEDWTEYVVPFVVPDGVDPENLGMFFSLANVNTIYFDDVSVRRLPEKDTASPRTGNLVKNGSFEAGRVHWSGDIRGRSGYRSDTIIIDESYDFSINESDAAAGKRSWSMTIPESSYFNLTSAYFPARYGHPLTIGFSARSSKPTSASFSFGSGKVRPEWSLKTNFTTSVQWERKTYTIVPKPSSSGTYLMEFSFSTPCDFRLDAVSAIEGEVDDPAAPSALREAALMRSESHPGNVFYPGEKIEFIFAMPAPIELDVITLDAWDKAVQKQTVSAKDGSRLSFPSSRLGTFKIELRERSGTLLSETLYSVVPRLKAPSEVNDSFFGTHSLFSEYSLDLVTKAGFRWLRTYPPHYTAWYLIEEKPGDWLWLTNRAAAARARGFKILGLLNTTPVHEGDSDSGQKSTIWSPYAPKDWEKWRAYVKQTVSTFSPWIQHWEVWNEPDGNYLMLKKGNTNREGTYFRIVDESRAAVDEIGANITLLAGAAASPTGGFFNRIVDMDIASHADGISHHWYYENASPDQLPDTPFTVQASERFGGMKNRAGKVPELWQTEGGIYLNGAKTWLTSWEIPPVSPYGVRDAANTLARTVIAFKAAGYKRNFFYMFIAKPTGRLSYLDWCTGMNDTDGTPHPGFAAHAAAVHFLDEASPDGFIYPDIPDTPKHSVFIAKFVKAGKRIDVLWSKKPIALSLFPEEYWKGRAVYDMFGNPAAITAATIVDSNPIYCVMR